jgi:hypothetical protein
MYGLDAPASSTFLSIADFYYLFPSELKQLNNWPRKNSRDYAIVNSIEECHEHISDPRMTFFEMKEVRNNAFLNLISRGIIFEMPNSNRSFSLIRDSIPDALIDVLDCDTFRTSHAYQIITKKLILLPLNGNNGLKAKSGLMEYRYDA